MTKVSKTLAAGLTVALLFLGASQSQAASFNINLQGTVSNGNYSSFVSGPTQYDQWSLALTGLSGSNAFVVSNGDTINATITLDQSFTIPASANITSFVLFLSGTTFPSISTEVSGTTSFFDGVIAGPSGGTSTSTLGALANAISLFPPDNGAITFDSFVSSFTITTLGAPAAVDYASISYTLFNVPAVPEPATTAMLVAGLGILGAFSRRRKSTTA